MEDQKIQSIKSIKENSNGEIEVVVIMDREAMAEKFMPYYNIQEDLRKALLPILLKEILKNKEKIVKKVLLEVDWTEIVRSEVAQKVIQEIASKRSY